MMDPLEQFIQDNRKKMDSLEPVPVDKMWDAFATNTPNRQVQEPPVNHLLIRQPNLWKRVAFAATIIALAGWGLWFFQPAEPAFSLADISPELAEKETRLQQLISQKEQEIKLEDIDKKTYADLLNDLDLINKNTEATKTDLSQFPNERAIETLIRNYELKIRILENLNREIEKSKYYDELEKSI